LSGTSRTDRPVAIIVAVQQELSALLKRMPLAERESAGGFSFYKGVVGSASAIVAKSGMGVERAREMTRVICRTYKPASVLIAGFGGGLAEEIAPGDLVVAEKVIDERAAYDNVLIPDAGLLASARVAAGQGLRVHCGPLVTVPHVVETSERKRLLLQRFPGALALDMESAGAAAVAEVEGVPWVAVRAITDGVADDLPLVFERYANIHGETSLPRVIAAVAVRPWKIPALVQLGKRAGLAAGNLAAFVEGYVRTVADETACI
jgi:adenosylhomocysteine nucleosidase